MLTVRHGSDETPVRLDEGIICLRTVAYSRRVLLVEEFSSRIQYLCNQLGRLL